jgi:hypothetical protein
MILILQDLALILAAWLQKGLPKHKTAVKSLLFVQKKFKKFVILHKRLVFDFLQASFYQNNVKFDYSFKMFRFGPI